MAFITQTGNLSSNQAHVPETQQTTSYLQRIIQILERIFPDFKQEACDFFQNIQIPTEVQPPSAPQELATELEQLEINIKMHQELIPLLEEDLNDQYCNLLAEAATQQMKPRLAEIYPGTNADLLKLKNKLSEMKSRKKVIEPTLNLMQKLSHIEYNCFQNLEFKDEVKEEIAFERITFAFSKTKTPSHKEYIDALQKSLEIIENKLKEQKEEKSQIVARLEQS